MFIEENGTRYGIIRGSDIVRDGMYLELNLPDTSAAEAKVLLPLKKPLN